MTTPNPSLESLAYRPTSMPALARSAGAERALVFIRMSFALRGAPCGSDAWLGPAIGGYHGQKPPSKVATDRDEPGFVGRMVLVEPLDGEVVPERDERIAEGDAVVPDILGLLGGVPAELDHAPDTTDRPSPAGYHGHRRSTSVKPRITALSFAP